jgi:hypothetical protein
VYADLDAVRFRFLVDVDAEFEPEVEALADVEAVADVEVVADVEAIAEVEASGCSLALLR